MLKEKTAADLASLSLDATNLSYGLGGTASSDLAVDERSLTLSKLRYRFQYETETNQTYLITRSFTVWSNGVVYSTNLATTNLVSGDGKTHWETNDIIPAVENGAIVFDLGQGVRLGEIANSVAVGVREVTVVPYDPGCGASCGSGGDGEGPIGGRGIVLGNLCSLRWSLGHGAGGIRVGEVTVTLDTLTPALYTPASLRLLVLPDKVTVVTNADGSLRQAGSSQCLADVQQIVAGRSFKLTFYPTNAFLPGNGNNLIPTNGLSPEVAWTVDNPDTGASNRLRVVETRASFSITNVLTWDAQTGQWEVLTGNGLRKDSLTKSWDVNYLIRTDIRQVINPASSQVVGQTTETYQLFDWGEGLTERVAGTGAHAQTNTYTYQADGRLAGIANADGSWQAYTYDERGRAATVTSSGADYNTRTVSYTYDDALEAYGDNPELWPVRPRIVTEALNSTTVAKTFFLASANRHITVRAASDTGDPFASGNLCTTNYYYPDGDPNATRLKAIEHPDGTVTLYSYGTDPNYVTNVVLSGEPNGAHTDIVNGTKTVTVLGSLGELLRTEVYDVNGSTTTLAARGVYTYTDALKRSHWVSHLDGTSNLVQYACCGLDLTVDRDGATAQYYNDGLKRRVAVCQVDFNITTTNVLDAAGNLLRTIRTGSTGSPVTNYQAAYDLAGRVAFETNALGGVTSYSYGFNAAGYFARTNTFPDGGQRIETYQGEGSLYRVTGSATQPMQYDFSAGYSTETRLDADGNPTSEFVTTYTDLLGRHVKTENADWSYSTAAYNSRGQLWQQVDADGVTNLYAYNSLGQLEYTAVDMDGDQEIDFNGLDRVTRVVSDVVTDYGVAVRRTRTYARPTNNLDAPLLISTAETSVDGLRSWRTVWNNGAGVTNRMQIAHTANNYRYVTNRAPDGARTISQFQYGRLLSVASLNAAGGQIGKTTYGYDAHGRQQTVTDARNGTTTYGYNNANQVTSLTTPAPGNGQSAQSTTTEFDNLGRAVRIIQPDGTSITNRYAPTGLPTNTCGSRTYPVDYTYDTAGRMTSMTTWTNFASGQGAAVTTWNYDSYRGWLSSKYYADYQGPTYYYTSAGRLQTRGWARGLTTTYSYNSAGDLSGVDYSDQTPDVTYAYDRLGRQITSTQGDLTTTRTHGDTGQLLTESYSGGALDGLSVTNGYDQFLRRTNLSALNGSTSLAFSTYSYDNASRLWQVSDGTNSATYTYLANSPLVGQILFTNAGVRRMTTTNAYDYLNRLSSISSVPSASSVVGFAYQYNSANQRTRATWADGSYWLYSYDSLGQVVSAKRYWVDQTPVAGQQNEYAFDDIGNRASANSGGDTNGANLRETSYAANLLNQYTSVVTPGYEAIVGAALATNAVTVNAGATTRRGEYFHRELSLANGSGPVWQSVTVSSGGSNVTGHVLFPPYNQSPTCDADGNLTADGLWTYDWDAENRLLSVTSQSTVPSAAQVKVEFAYDHKGRRIQKIVSMWNGSAYVPQRTNRFVYDGWNLIAILDDQSAILQSFVWGSDLSGSLQGAGGVGGLLSVTVHSGANGGTYFPAYDGNGNVMALISATDGSAVARYEYDAFGNVLRATGPLAQANPFLFSTKFYDWETGLYYYGYRYYNPMAGRWPSRDPVAEEAFAVRYLAGKSREERSRFKEQALAPLYIFVCNAPIRGVDAHGLKFQFENCGEFEQKKIKQAWDAACAKIQGSDYGKCLCNKTHLECLKGKCANKPTTFVCEHYGSLDQCKPKPPSTRTPCALGAAPGDKIWICPKAWESSGSNCGPLACTLAHELMHNCRRGLGEKWPRRAEYCVNKKCGAWNDPSPE